MTNAAPLSPNPAIQTARAADSFSQAEADAGLADDGAFGAVFDGVAQKDRPAGSSRHAQGVHDAEKRAAHAAAGKAGTEGEAARPEKTDRPHARGPRSDLDAAAAETSDGHAAAAATASPEAASRDSTALLAALLGSEAPSAGAAPGTRPHTDANGLAEMLGSSARAGKTHAAKTEAAASTGHHLPSEPLSEANEAAAARKAAASFEVVARETHFAPVNEHPVAQASFHRQKAGDDTALAQGARANGQQTRAAAAAAETAARQIAEPKPMAGGVTLPSPAPETRSSAAPARDRQSRGTDAAASTRRAQAHPVASIGEQGNVAETAAERAERVPGGAAKETRDPAAPIAAGVDAAASTGAPTGLPSSVFRQIADSVASEAARLAAAPQTAGAETQAVGPVRFLEIRLNPGDLGTVTVRLRMSGGELGISLRASNATTARLLEQDRASLDKALSAAGCSSSELTIITGAHVAATPGSAADQARGFPAPTPQGDAQDNGSPSNEGGRQPGQQRNNDDQAAPGRRRDGGHRFEPLQG